MHPSFGKTEQTKFVKPFLVGNITQPRNLYGYSLINTVFEHTQRSRSTTTNEANMMRGFKQRLHSLMDGEGRAGGEQSTLQLTSSLMLVYRCVSLTVVYNMYIKQGQTLVNSWMQLK